MGKFIKIFLFGEGFLFSPSPRNKESQSKLENGDASAFSFKMLWEKVPGLPLLTCQELRKRPVIEASGRYQLSRFGRFALEVIKVSR